MQDPLAERVQASCAVIWGPGDYDIDIETTDWTGFWAVVKKDFGDTYGPTLTMTPVLDSIDSAWIQLDQELYRWAQHVLKERATQRSR